MKIISEKPLTISTLWGTSIRLEAGKEREVGDEIGILALQQGAKEVVGTNQKTESPEMVRARNAKGHYIPDDPTTPDINEAWVEKKVDDDLLQVMKNIIADGDPRNFKKDGSPKAAVINRALGRTVGTDARVESYEAALNDQ